VALAHSCSDSETRGQAREWRPRSEATPLVSLLALPLLEQSLFFELPLDLIALDHALALIVEPALHVTIAGRLNLLTLLRFGRLIDELVARDATEKGPADDRCRTPFAAADQRAQHSARRRAANGAERGAGGSGALLAWCTAGPKCGKDSGHYQTCLNATIEHVSTPVTARH
jgi:hypothetical protein